jgi:hypothetical protein
MAAALATAAYADDGITVSAAILTLPDKLANLTRPVQINGIPLTLPENGTITVQTSAGNMTLRLLAATSGGANALADLLTPLVQNRKPFGITIQPDSSSAQALLSLPNPASAPAAPPVNPARPAFNAFLQNTLSSGQEITATILPKDVAAAFTALSSVNEAASFAADLRQSAQAGTPTSSFAGVASMKDFLASSLKPAFLGDFLKSATTAKLAETLKGLIAPTPAQTKTTVITTPTSINVEQPSPQNAAVNLKPDTEWHFRVDTAVPPGKPLPSPPTAGQIVATVIGKGPDGQLLLSAGDRTLYIRQNSGTPTGSTLLLTPLSPITEPDYALQPLTDFKAPALQRLMEILASIEPHLAQQIMQTRIPQPNASLPSTLLFFLNALNQSGVQGWLGNEAAARLSKMDKLELIAGLADEMLQGGGIARDPTIGQWRAWPIPLYNDQQFQMLHLYVRQESDRRQDNQGHPVSPQTRFLVTMDMTRLGPMQLDGLSQKRKLDLIVRSERPLPSALPNELRGLYVKTLDALGLIGNIGFQTGRQSWIDIRKTAERAGVVT